MNTSVVDAILPIMARAKFCCRRFKHTSESLGLLKNERLVESLLDLANRYFCWRIQNDKMSESCRFIRKGGCFNIH